MFRFTRLDIVLGALVAFAVSACHGEDTTGPAGTDPCAVVDERNSHCETGGSVDVCTDNLACWQSLLRPADREELFLCIAKVPCAGDTYACHTQVAAKYKTDPVVSAYESSCLARRTACANRFSETWCVVDHGALTDAARAAQKDCLARDCATIRKCFDDVYYAAGCTK